MIPRASAAAARTPADPNPRPRLVITGDDVGLRSDWDDAILDCLSRGVITSTSVMANGATFPPVARLLRERDFDCGVHLNVIHGRPVLPPREVPSLVLPSGEFPGRVGGFLFRYLTGRARVEEIAREWEAQVRRVFDAGLRPTHLNAHYHLHGFPALFRETTRLAKSFGIRWVRLPDDPSGIAARTGAEGRWTAELRTRTLGQVFRRLRPLIPAGVAGISCRGIAASGGFDEGRWNEVLASVHRDAAHGEPLEIMCHPGQTVAETRALGAADLPERIHSVARLLSFRDLCSEVEGDGVAA